MCFLTTIYIKDFTEARPPVGAVWSFDPSPDRRRRQRKGRRGASALRVLRGHLRLKRLFDHNI